MELVITKTEPVRRGNIKIWINEEPAFRLPEEECRRLSLSPGRILEEEELARIHTDLLLPLARKRCLDILLISFKSTEAVRRKLLEEDFPEDVTGQAVAYARSYHYLDDLRYACSFIEQNRERKSLPQIRMLLRQKGVSDADIDRALEETGPVDSAAQIRRWAEKKRYDPETAEPKETARFFRFLLQKGFSYGEIKKTLT